MITKKKNLHTGESYWVSKGLPSIEHQNLKRDISTDITIIGAGITGAMLAAELAGKGFKVSMFDRRLPLHGSTCATTALLQYEIDQPLSLLAKQIGQENAMRAWRRSKLALDNLIAKIESLNINCDLRPHTSLYLSGNLLNAKELKEEASQRNLIGLYTEYFAKKAVQDSYGIVRPAALKSFGNISTDPCKMTAGFLGYALQHKAKIYSQEQIDEVIPHASGVTAITKNNKTINSKYLIYATGYEVPKCIDKKIYSLHSTWAIATKPQDKIWPEDAMIWEASDPYLYIRSTKDKRVICGGEDEDFENEEKRDALLPQKTKLLEEKLGKIFPYLSTKAQFAWTGSFGTTKSGLPLIGPIPNMKNCFAVLSFGGNGITYSRIAAEIIPQLIEGEEVCDRELYAFDRGF